MKWTPSTSPSSSPSTPTTDSNSEPNITLCYDRHTGYGGYGTWDRGGRQILLQTNQTSPQGSSNSLDRTSQSQGQDRIQIPDARTWVRLEDGTISGEVNLSTGAGAGAGVFASTSGSGMCVVPGGGGAGVGTSRVGAVVLLAWVVFGRVFM